MLKPRIVIVEGNIGAGKSTFLRLIKDHLQAHLIYEPVEQWQNVQGENALEHFYTNPNRWAYTFQTYAFVTRVLALQEQSKSVTQPIIVLERSIYSDRYCFAKNAFELGYMNNLEWKLYQEWFSWLEEIYTQKPDAFIYLRTTPESCYSRMIKRNRSEETAVGLDYLTLVHNKHEQWLLGRQDLVASIKDTPVLTLDCDKEFETNINTFNEYCQEIVDFFETKFNLPPLTTRVQQPYNQQLL